MVIRCCVPGCKTKGTSGFHNFPTNSDKRLLWIENTKTNHLKENDLSNSYRRVCKKHFRADDYETHANGLVRLKYNAVPSLHLPLQLSDTFQTNCGSSSTVSLDNNEMEIFANDNHLIQTIQMELDVGNYTAWTAKSYGNYSTEEVGNLKDSRIQHSIGSASPDDDYSKCENHFENGDVEMLPESSYFHDSKSKLDDDDERYRKLLEENTVMARELHDNQEEVKRLSQLLKENEPNDENVLKYLMTKFNSQQLEFFKMQLKNSGKKSHGQRYTDEQKSLSLALYKQGPKCYRFMQKIFRLPSKRTLGRHSAHLLFESGINTNLFDFIKKKVNSLSEIDKYCTISWDEQSLKAHLEFSQARDLIDGFVDFAAIRRPTFATHALAFMVRGINVPFKQAVGYFFTYSLYAVELAELIRLVTEAVLDTGLKIVGSVCDQIGINVSAVHKLIGSPFKPGDILKYKIRGNTIIHCYDAPHLIKVVRNNFTKKHLRHCISERWDVSTCNNIKKKGKRQRTASWDDVSNLYSFNLRGTERFLPKITDEHINPLRRKMKVSVATQVFSETFGNAMIRCSGTKHFPRDLSGTAQILLFFNDLFDSVNGSDNHSHGSGMLKGSINKDSVHFVFWEYALEMLGKMNFIDKVTGAINNRSTVILKFMSTIKGYIEITKICLKLNMKKVSLRHTNQDGLENFFCCVKLCCQVGVSPTITQFRTGFTTIVINNFSNKYSMNSNCEDDLSTPLTIDFHKFLLNCKDKDQSPVDNNQINDESSYLGNEVFDPQISAPYQSNVNGESSELENIILEPQFSAPDLNFAEEEAMTYICSEICKKLLAITDCEDCINNLTITEISVDFALRNPSSVFIRNFKHLYCAISDIIPRLCSEKSLMKKIISKIETVEMDEIGCPDHNIMISTKLKVYSIQHGIISFCNNINSLLSGKITILPTKSNQIQSQALIYKQKNKRIGKYSDIFVS